MKTFIYENIERLQRFKLTIDVKAALCRTPWLVPNDEGKRIEYVFKHDGSIIMSTNGIVSYGEWTFEPLIMALFIKSNDVTMNFKPVFYDENLLALNLDGTSGLLFLVNQTSQAYVNSIDYSQSVTYLNEKEQENYAAVKEEERIKRLKELEYLNSYEEIEKQYSIYYNLHKADIDSLKKKRNHIVLNAVCLIIIDIALCIFLCSIITTRVSAVVAIFFLAVMVFIYYRAMLKTVQVFKDQGLLSEADFCDSPLEDRLELINKEELLN